MLCWLNRQAHGQLIIAYSACHPKIRPAVVPANPGARTVGVGEYDQATLNDQK